MGVRLRLRRTGTRKKPCYRVVAADTRSPRDGRFIENIGLYDPRQQNEELNLERAEYWLSVGAQPSETVAAIIERARAGKPMRPAVKPKIAPAEVAEAAPAAEAAPEPEAAAEPKAAAEAVEPAGAEAVEAETPAEETPEAAEKND